MSDNSMPIKILYISSPSRSGSTVLEHALGAIEGVINVGEIRRLRDFTLMNKEKIVDPANQRGCTCGLSIRSCEFWKAVEMEAGLDFSTIQLSSQLGLINRNLFKLLFLVLGVEKLRKVSEFYKPFSREIGVGNNCFDVYKAINKITGAECIIDSSKIINQYIILKVANPESTNLIALFRDGRAVSKSLIRGDRKYTLKKSIVSFGKNGLYRTAVLSWMKSTLQIHVFFKRAPGKSRVFIKYEIFCKSPSLAINNIFSKFNISLDCEDNNRFKQSHSIGGSPSRFKKSFSDVTLDQSWMNSQTKAERRIFNRYAGIVNHILGYD